MRLGKQIAILSMLLFIYGCSSIPTNGYGDVKFSGGRRYVGNFVGGCPQQGITFYTDGGQYQGDYYCPYHGQYFRAGFGTFTDKNGVIYKGYWSEDYLNGKVTQYWKDGAISTGEWKKGLREGPFSYTSKDFSGTINYKNGKRNGKGMDQVNLNNVIVGRFIGDFVDGEPTSGTTFTNDGRKFIGTFQTFDSPLFPGTRVYIGFKGKELSTSGALIKEGRWHEDGSFRSQQDLDKEAEAKAEAKRAKDRKELEAKQKQDAEERASYLRWLEVREWSDICSQFRSARNSCAGSLLVDGCTRIRLESLNTKYSFSTIKDRCLK